MHIRKASNAFVYSKYSRFSSKLTELLCRKLFAFVILTTFIADIAKKKDLKKCIRCVFLCKTYFASVHSRVLTHDVHNVEHI